jgi:two-component system nitrogen regulation response regulator GlnG
MMGGSMTSSVAPVYIVDDDSSVRESVGSLIRSAGWPVLAFGSAREFLDSRWASTPSCLVLDLDLPGMTGLELQQQLDPRFSVIFLTGRGDIPTSVRAMKAGAQEFLLKPPPADELLEAVGRALAKTPLGYAHAQPSGSDPLPPSSRVGMIGKSRALREVLDLVEAVAPSDATVLILGETGTGKERVARAVHDHSPRRSQPFVSVNCAAIPQSLIASDLFGHEKGAFTGAVQRRIGRFEQAHGGTIFLDEVGELPAETQIALLRVLQEREFERVGGRQPIAADVRVIAATNRDLPAAIAGGSFRSDLFYRLNVFPIEVPPLRERKEDIPLLVEYFMNRDQGTVRRARSIPPRTLELLDAYSWPGNIRELQNVVERALIVSSEVELTVDARWLLGPSTEPSRQSVSAPPRVRETPTPEAPPTRTSDETFGTREPSSEPAGATLIADGSLAELERQMILRTLAAVSGNRRRAATRLGIGLRTLYEKLKRYDLQ